MKETRNESEVKECRGEEVRKKWEVKKTVRRQKEN